jgi:hypothetical protein
VLCGAFLIFPSVISSSETSAGILKIAHDSHVPEKMTKIMTNHDTIKIIM